MLKKASEKEHKISTENNYPEWGTPLSLEEYFLREKLLQSYFPLEFTPLVLVPKNNTKSAEILGQCETYENILNIFYCDIDGVKMMESKSVAIASVYVPLDRRNKGYGSSMMAMLSERLKNEGLVASCLYSDIGPKFYARHGWEAFSPFQLSIKVKELESLLDNIIDKDVIPIREHDLDVYANAYNSNLTEKVNEFFKKPCNKDSAVFAYKVTPATIKIFRIRTFTYYNNKYKAFKVSDELSQMDLFDRPFGHAINNDFFLYFHDYRNNILYVVCHCVSSNSEDLLYAAVNEAKESKLEKISVWNPDLLLCQALANENGKEFIKTVQMALNKREKLNENDFKFNEISLAKGVYFGLGSSIPALAIYKENLEKLTSKKFKNYHWLNNEKYPWA